jgi:cytochrome b pre-mRNA-processing protein 3
VTFFRRRFGSGWQRQRLQPLYRAVVARAREPAWYLQGAVPDTIDGRFDMIAAVLALVLIRLEGGEDRDAPTLLAEAFIEDMEGSIRQIGIGDLIVGKEVGKMMGALGGRLTAFRTDLAAGGDFSEPVRRNIFHETPVAAEAIDFVARRLFAFHAGLRDIPVAAIVAGRLPDR